MKKINEEGYNSVEIVKERKKKKVRNIGIKKLTRKVERREIKKKEIK